MSDENGQGKEIYGKMAAILRDVEAISKSGRNEAQGYKFRGIDDVYNMVHPLLSQHQVFCLPRLLGEETTERTTEKGTILRFVKLTMAYDFFAPDGSHVTAEVVGEAMDSGDKASNKAMSAAHKYVLLQTFCIPTGDGADSEQDTYQVRPGAKAVSRSNTAPEPCPDCGGAMWDNRATKKGNQPDYKCKDKVCNKAVWVEDESSKETPDQAAIRELMAQAERLLPPTSKKLAQLRGITDPNELGRKVQILIDLKKQKQAASTVNPADPEAAEKAAKIVEIRAAMVAGNYDEQKYMGDNYGGITLAECSLDQLIEILEDLVPF